MPRAFVDSNVLIYSVGCDVLYSEDLQHGQVIDGTLTIVNPFVG